MGVPLQVVFDVPKDIYEGLLSGRLVRHRPGVVQVAKGYEGAGQVKALLKELPTSTGNPLPNFPQIQSVGLGPFAAVAGVSITCTAILYAKLEMMDKKLNTLIEGQHRILSAIEEIKGFELLNLSAELFQAKEAYIYRDYQRASLRCVDAAGKLKGYLEFHDFVYHMNHRSELEYVLRMLASTIALHVNAAANINNEEPLEILRVNGEYLAKLCENFSESSKQLKRRISQFIPTSEEHSAYEALRKGEPLRPVIEAASYLCLSEAAAGKAVIEMSNNKEIESCRCLCVLPLE